MKDPTRVPVLPPVNHFVRAKLIQTPDIKVEVNVSPVLNCCVQWQASN